MRKALYCHLLLLVPRQVALLNDTQPTAVS